MIKKQYKIGDKIGGELSVIDIFGGETKSGMGVSFPKTSKSGRLSC